MKHPARFAKRVATRAARSALKGGEQFGRDLWWAASMVRPGRRPPPGTSPGTLIADPAALPPVTRIMAWGPDGLVEEEGFDPARITALRARWPIVWVDVDGLGDVTLIERVGNLFGLHRLALEDVLDVGQRAKAERYPDHLFLVSQLMTLDRTVVVEQVNLFVGRGFVVTFQARPGDSLEPVRVRARGGRGRMRTGGAGYLAYAIIDTIVDNYFPILEVVGERLDVLENEIIERPGEQVMARIHALRRNLMVMRRSIWPMREILSGLAREPGEPFEAEDRLYIQDSYDHTIQVMDLLENYREIGSGLMDIYLSSLSHRMNEVMKVLTIIATIFIPLGFIAGVYGMNFDTSRSPYNMPELGWRLGYPFALALMSVVALGLLVFFHRKGWIGGSQRLSAGATEDSEPGHVDDTGGPRARRTPPASGPPTA